MRGVYDSFSEVIDKLHKYNVKYLILRNYDNLLERSLYVDGHGDVDMLVDDSSVVSAILEAQTYPLHGNDGTHFKIIVDGQPVSLDLRHVNDGYYCSKWQKEMLERRILYNGFYVLNQEDSFYSLIYHAILQKPSLSTEYKSRLVSMAKSLKIFVKDTVSANDFVSLLEQYMVKNGYRYTYPSDVYVPLKTGIIDKTLIEKNSKLFWKHWKYDMKLKMINFAVKCKHLIFNGKPE